MITSDILISLQSLLNIACGIHHCTVSVTGEDMCNVLCFLLKKIGEQ